MSKDDKTDYEVGYGKPPKATRFQKGQSGNPKGRPKEARGFRASLQRELEAPVRIREGDREVRISKGEAVAKRVVEKSLKGDLGAARLIAALDGERVLALAAAGSAAAAEPEPVDAEILDHLLKLLASDAVQRPTEATDHAGRDEDGEGAE